MDHNDQSSSQQLAMLLRMGAPLVALVEQPQPSQPRLNLQQQSLEQTRKLLSWMVPSPKRRIK